MKPHNDEPGRPLSGLWNFGDKLLRFAGEDNRLDSDALYKVWTESDRLAWADTQQESRAQRPRAASAANRLVVADEDGGPSREDFARTSPCVGGRMARGPGSSSLRLFRTEIELWHAQRQSNRKAEGKSARTGTEGPHHSRAR